LKILPIMKTAIRFAIGLVLVSLSSARDFRPDGRLENIPASDTSVQQCYIFRTVPGVLYRVESTHDLSNWTAGDEIYGMGHEFVTAMREYTPPPPAPPVTPPATPPVPAIHASLRVRPSSGTAGGTVVSWKSLDHGGPAVMLLAQAMTSNWSRMPLYWDRFGNHDFFIGCDGPSIPPPAENRVLGIKDAAMFEELETSFPAINLVVDESVARARNAPAPAPPDPNSRKFWRVFCDWSLDTDQDGSPDWAEFEMGALTTGGPTLPLRGDAFNDDTNNNGIPDGEELDLDGDGMADAKDGDIAGGPGNGQDGNIVEWKRTPGFQFAAFELPMGPDGPPDPDFLILDDLSENGSVLFTTVNPTHHTPESRILIDRNLTAHEFPAWIEPLAEEKDDFQSYSIALIGDDILGILTVEGSTPEFLSNEDHIWNPAAIAPTPNYTPYPFPGYHDSILDDRGTFRVTAHDQAAPLLLTTPFGVLPGSQDWGETRIEKNGNVKSKSGYWRFDSLTNSYGGRIPLPEATAGGSATLVQTDPGTTTTHEWTLAAGNTGLIVAKENGTFEQTKVTCKAGQTPVGVSNQGWMATKSEIWNYDKWLPLTKHFGGMNPSDAEMLNLLDTGLGVASITKNAASQKKMCLVFPISAVGIETDIESGDVIDNESAVTGVDGHSMTAYSGRGRVPEIWIMAPNGGASNTVRFRSPANGASPLSLGTTAQQGVFPVEFAPVALNSDDMTVLMSGKLSETDEKDVIIKRADTHNALNFPVRVKAMKKRTIKVAIHPVALKKSDQEAVYPYRIPSNDQEDRAYFDEKLTEVLDRIFGRQVNLFFDINVLPAVEVDFDTVAPFGEIEVTDESELTTEMALACTNPQWPGNTNIDVWILGGTCLKNGDKYYLGAKFGGTHGDDYQQVPSIIVDGRGSVGLTIAHEIGHVFMGLGHPDKSEDLHFATLFGVSNQKRLMKSNQDENSDWQLIKKEWDRIDAWLERNIKDEEQ
jgi:hypothetical protein